MREINHSTITTITLIANKMGRDVSFKELSERSDDELRLLLDEYVEEWNLVLKDKKI